MAITIITPEKSITDTAKVFEVPTKDLPKIADYKSFRKHIWVLPEAERPPLLGSNKKITDALITLFKSKGVDIDKIVPGIIDNNGYTLEFITHKGKDMRRYRGKVNGTITEIWDTVKINPLNKHEYQSKTVFTCDVEGCDFTIENSNSTELTEKQQQQIIIHYQEHGV